LYFRIKNLYNKLDKEDKLEFEFKMEELNSKLILYMKLKEALFLARKGDEIKLKYVLDNLPSLIGKLRNFPGSKEIIDYAEMQYKECLKIYSDDQTIKRLGLSLREIKKLLRRKKIYEAKIRYNALLSRYNRLPRDMEGIEKLHKTMSSVYKKIFRKEKKAIKKGIKKKKKISKKTVKKKEFIKADKIQKQPVVGNIQDLKDRIRKGNVDDAEKLYENLFGNK
jgi:hypothetical protein